MLMLAALSALAGPSLKERSLEHEGSTLRYAVQLPKGKGPHPLVLALHYAGEVTPWYGRGVVEQLLAPGLEDLGAVIVAPDCVGRDWTDPVSVTAVMAVLDAVVVDVQVDPERTLVAGYSMGGMGAWHLGTLHPERFRAVVAVAGRPVGDPAELKRPLVAIHGARDAVVPIGPTLAAVASLQERGHAVKFVRLPELTHYQVPAYVPALRSIVPWIREQWALR
jgi:dipeptidyl aminopeptidase/acylaminoacyl peptidase